jgi:hypothetical protein
MWKLREADINLKPSHIPVMSPLSRSRRANILDSYQYNAFGTCPGGLIEGIADWVRLNANLSPPHWKKEATGNWDAGYQHTGYFLDYLEQRFGKGTIRRMNEKLRIQKYEEKRFWTELLGRPVEQLWGDYSQAIDKESKKNEDDEECVIVEKQDASTPKSVEEPATPVSRPEDEQQSTIK